MKKLLVLLIVVALPTIMFGQVEKGHFLIDVDFSFHGGSLDVADQGQTVRKSREFDVDLRLGYTIVNNLEVGLAVVFDSTSLKQEQDLPLEEQKQSTNFYGLFARYYLMSTSKLKPFIGAAYGFGDLKNEIINTSVTKYGVSQIIGEVGLAYFLNKHWGFELEIAYVKTKYRKDDENIDTFDMDGSFFTILYGVIVSF